jgi:hypothetical protein
MAVKFCFAFDDSLKTFYQPENKISNFLLTCILQCIPESIHPNAQLVCGNAINRRIAVSVFSSIFVDSWFCSLMPMVLL